jgi:hypothetical protein
MISQTGQFLPFARILTICIDSEPEATSQKLERLPEQFINNGLASTYSIVEQRFLPLKPNFVGRVTKFFESIPKISIARCLCEFENQDSRSVLFGKISV